MSVTLKDIAERTGFSVRTVSCVLNNKKDRISEQTSEKINACARRLRYRPNASARAIQAGRFNHVGLLLSQTESSRSYLPTPLIHGIYDGLAENGQNLLLTKITDEELSGGETPSVFRELMLDGLIINFHFRIPQRMESLAGRSGLPNVWLNVKRETDGVRPDDFGGGREATERLLNLGHRRIAYLDYISGFDSPEHFSRTDRYEGYKSAMVAAGLPERAIYCEKGVPAEDRIEFSKAFLSAEHRPTAVVTYSESEALATVMAAASSGLKLPDELSVVTFSNDAIKGMPIATMILPWYQVGLQAAAMIQAKIRQPEKNPPYVVIPCTLEQSEFCVPPTSAF